MGEEELIYTVVNVVVCLSPPLSCASRLIDSEAAPTVVERTGLIIAILVAELVKVIGIPL